MQLLQFIEVEEEVIVEEVRLKSSERECRMCEAVLVLNEKEQCYECLDCGYIDCGEED